ncbi:MAG TPA: hypothetical protein VGL18_10260 [Actinomycetota bacterium]|jgi:hypothetical protein
MADPGFDRRAFLRKAAVTGATVAWAAPVIQTVGASSAFAAAGTGGDQWSICVGACNSAPSKCPPADPVEDPQNTGCQVICTQLCGNPNENLPCCNSNALSSAHFCSVGGNIHGACYFGSLAGCPGRSYNSSCCGGRNAFCATKDGPTDQCQCSLL